MYCVGVQVMLNFFAAWKTMTLLLEGSALYLGQQSDDGIFCCQPQLILS